MTISQTCECGEVVEGGDLDAFADAFLAHARAKHPEWPFPDTAIRNYAQATQRLAPVMPRLDSIGKVEVHPVTEDRIDDWLAFFDRDAFAGNPAWAACYCMEPHSEPDEWGDRPWRRNRDAMVELLRTGGSFGYLAYVDGRPAGWCNASKRSAYTLYRQGEEADPRDGEVVGVACFVIAPPYRRHGLSAALLDRVLADAPGRGVRWVEAYPFNEAREDDAANFRGPRALLEERGFEPVEERERYTVVRRTV